MPRSRLCSTMPDLLDEWTRCTGAILATAQAVCERKQGIDWSTRCPEWSALRLRVLHTPTRTGRARPMGCIAPASLTHTAPVSEGGPDRFLKKALEAREMRKRQEQR